MADLLVDTDVFVDHLRGARAMRRGGDRLFYSVITRCELFAGTDPEPTLRRLLSLLEACPVDERIAERAGRVRRRHMLRTPDALIAATALEHELTLLTRNVKDFRQVRGLRLRQAR